MYRCTPRFNIMSKTMEFCQVVSYIETSTRLYTKTREPVYLNVLKEIFRGPTVEEEVFQGFLCISTLLTCCISDVILKCTFQMLSFNLENS